jgi:DNA-cytosine methyltransferase
MNVLSLFDGMSCGQIALNRLGIKYHNYYAAEIDKYAMEVTKKNYPNTIHLGDVTKVKAVDLELIDLLMGGSPCQGFSFAGKQLNFDDPRSALFFEFVRLLRECKPKYFLLENVRMKQQHQDVITEHLGVEPIMINSALVSAQNRVRLYWTNIPNITQPQDKKLVLKDVLEYEPDNYTIMSNNFTNRLKENRCLTDLNQNKASNLSAMEYVKNGKQGDYLACTLVGKPKDNVLVREKSKTVRTGGRGSYDRHEWDSVGNKGTELYYRKLTTTECERLQTVPDNYTQGVSNTQRYKMLGNGWTVDVIAHILKNIHEKNNYSV